MRLHDTQGTIVARGTPAGTSAVAVIRLSGPEVKSILDEAVDGTGRQDPVGNPRSMCTARIMDKEERCLDEALVVFFPGPNSYTGEDLAEIHCHGGETVVAAVLARLIEAGARPAMRGEFTRRAFENGKMDLSRAEAVLRVIEAGTKEQLLAAQRLLGGEFHQELVGIRASLVQLLAHVEALVDFPEEPEAAKATLTEIEPQLERIDKLLGQVRRRVDPDCKVVIAGRPNVGKSSLINKVAGKRISIVTDQPGTTRDAVVTGIVLGGMSVALVDTAGSGIELSQGTVEIEAASIAQEHIERAGMLVWVTDRPDEGKLGIPEVAAPVLWVVNKSDLIPDEERESQEASVRKMGGVLISALTGHGIDKFLELTGKMLSEAYGPADGVPVTTRQEAALKRVSESIKRAALVLTGPQLELAAADIREALDALSELMGDNVEVDVLDLIFEEFCIGK